MYKYFLVMHQELYCHSNVSLQCIRTKRPVKELRGGQPLIWDRVIERDLNSINSTTKDAIVKAHDRNYQTNIVTRVKGKKLIITSQKKNIIFIPIHPHQRND